METRLMSRWVQQLGGLFMAVLGILLTWLTWRTAHTGRAFLTVGAAGPAFTLMGLALVCFPDYKTERIHRGESLEGLEGWALLTLRWRVVCLLGIALSGGYLLYLRGDL